jgi:hypothetical protein
MRLELERIEIPGEDEAERRAWEVVSRAFSERRPAPPPERRRLRPTLAAVAVGVVALVAVAGSLAGSRIVHSVREAVGLKTAAPALTRLPTGGRLLVTSAAGAWIVQPDGSKRLLGPYRQAAWSPHGLFVAVARGHELAAVDPHGNVRWSLARSGVIRLPRWAPDGFRIAYLDGATLRIVAGDGTGDRSFAAGVARVAPAWRPSATHEHVLAFSSARGELELYAVDGNELDARRRLPAVPLQLLWSSDGGRLIALSAHEISVFDREGHPSGSIGLGRRAVAAAFEPHTHRLSVVLGGARGDVVSFDVDRPGRPPREIFGGTGRFSGLAWSPDARWMLIAWPTANQWLFVPAAGGRRIAAVSGIAGQFASGTSLALFPGLDDWCCVP